MTDAPRGPTTEAPRRNRSRLRREPWFPLGPDFPMQVDLRRSGRSQTTPELGGSFRFTWWLAECRRRGYSVLLAWDESHALAIPGPGVAVSGERGPTTEELRARVLAQTQTLCGCRSKCGDDGDTEGPGTCKGLPRMPEPPPVEVVLVPRRPLDKEKGERLGSPPH